MASCQITMQTMLKIIIFQETSAIQCWISVSIFLLSYAKQDNTLLLSSPGLEWRAKESALYFVCFISFWVVYVQRTAGKNSRVRSSFQSHLCWWALTSLRPLNYPHDSWDHPHGNAWHILVRALVGPSQNLIDVTVSLAFYVFKVFSVFFSRFKSKINPGCTGE